MKSLYLVLVTVLLGMLIITGCGGPEPETPATTPAATETSGPQYGGTLRIIDDRPPSGSLGWFAEPNAPGGMWYYTMFEGLVRPQYSGEVEPLLAKEWAIADDLSSITFDLQPGVKFHDGSDFNAETAKWNLDLFIDAHMAATKDVESVEVIDSDTIKVNLRQYYNTILYSLNSIPMVSKAAYDAEGAEGLRWNPVGTGPFKFDKYVPDTVIKTVKFEDYWQQGKPYLDGIDISWITDPLTAAASFEAGEADAANFGSPQRLDDLKQKGFEILQGYTGAITLIPDSKNPTSPLADLKVRQAIDYAIDRDAMVNAKGYGMWVTTYQFAAPDSSAYNTGLQGREYNPEKAKELLAEAGYPSGLKITLYGDSSSTDKDSAVAVQGFLSEVGIDAQLNWLDYGGFVQTIMGGWTDGILMCTNGFSPNMNSACTMVWSQQAIFFVSVDKTDEMEQLMNEAMEPKDYEPEMVQTYLQKMHDDAMYLPLYSVIRGLAMNSGIHDLGYLKGYGPYTWNPVTAWMSN